MMMLILQLKKKIITNLKVHLMLSAYHASYIQFTAVKVRKVKKVKHEEFIGKKIQKTNKYR